MKVIWFTSTYKISCFSNLPVPTFTYTTSSDILDKYQNKCLIVEHFCFFFSQQDQVRDKSFKEVTVKNLTAVYLKELTGKTKKKGSCKKCLLV